jgi:hypothetical protein
LRTRMTLWKEAAFLGTIHFVKQNLSSAEARLTMSHMGWRDTTGGIGEAERSKPGGHQ